MRHRTVAVIAVSGALGVLGALAATGQDVADPFQGGELPPPTNPQQELRSHIISEAASLAVLLKIAGGVRPECDTPCELVDAPDVGLEVAQLRCERLSPAELSKTVWVSDDNERQLVSTLVSVCSDIGKSIGAEGLRRRADDLTGALRKALEEQ